MRRERLRCHGHLPRVGLACNVVSGSLPTRGRMLKLMGSGCWCVGDRLFAFPGIDSTKRAELLRVRLAPAAGIVTGFFKRLAHILVPVFGSGFKHRSVAHPSGFGGTGTVIDSPKGSDVGFLRTRFH